MRLQTRSKSMPDFGGSEGRVEERVALEGRRLDRFLR